LVLATAALAGSAAAAPVTNNERRCEGHTGVTLEDQIRACTKVLAGTPSRLRLSVAYFNRGWAFNLSGRYERALQDFDKAIALEPDFEQAFRSKGDAYRRKGMIKQAIAEFDRAIRIKPDYATAYADRALAHQALGSVEQALQDFDKTIALLPDVGQHYFARALVFERTGRFDAALADLDRAITLEPHVARYIAARGRVKARLGRNDLAAADFQSALKLDSRLIGPRRWLKQFEQTKPPLRGSAVASPTSADARAAATPVKTVVVRLAWPICRKTRERSTKPLPDRTLRIPAAFGEQVRASADGTVVAVDPKSDAGNLIEVRHADGLVTEYGFLSAAFVQPSDLVQQGQVIGQVGTSDRAEAQLQFAAYRDDQPIDPLTALTAKRPACRTK
jgi:murein DD-endopeptidase MepM/ murein hydrolase activator NlpD